MIFLINFVSFIFLISNSIAIKSLLLLMKFDKNNLASTIHIKDGDALMVPYSFNSNNSGMMIIVHYQCIFITTEVTGRVLIKQ